MISNLAEFQLDLTNFARIAVPEAHGLLVKKIAFELFTRIVLKTPVDTGRARANWSVSIGAPSGTISAATDKAGGATISAGVQGINGAAPAQQVIWLENNLPYIEALEDGSSLQAPAGMVEGSLQEVQTFINQL